MAVDLLPNAEEHLLLRPDELISLADAGISGGSFAMRDRKQPVLERLLLSEPKEWPPILVTRSTSGYIVIDGYHRWEVARAKGERLFATCTPFASENDVIEAAFEANLRHGYASDKETRSNYAYWLHVTYPNMTQVEIARKALLSQSTVSAAIAERNEQLKEATHLAGLSEDERAHFQQRKKAEKLAHSFTKTTLKLLEATDTLDDTVLAPGVY